MTDEQVNTIARAALAHRTADEIADIAADLAGKITPDWKINANGSLSLGEDDSPQMRLIDLFAALAEMRRERNHARKQWAALHRSVWNATDEGSRTIIDRLDDIADALKASIEAGAGNLPSN